VASFDKVIPSGQEGKVNLSVKTKNMRGKFTKSATIRSNDPEHPSYRIKLKGTIKNYITVHPSPRAYLTGFEGDTLSQILTMSTNEEEPLTITNITSTLDDHITYEIKTLLEGKSYELTVTTREDVKDRAIGTITLTTSSKQKPKLEIPVRINFKNELTISPSTLFFGSLPLTSSTQEALFTKQIRVRKERGEPLAIEKIIPSSDFIKTAIETTVEGKRYSITVTLEKDKLQKGLLKETLEIYTNYQKKPVFTITLKGKII
jgi:hypothetical protein